MHGHSTGEIHLGPDWEDERVMRFELTTSTLARLRSTPELHPHSLSVDRAAIIRRPARTRKSKGEKNPMPGPRFRCICSLPMPAPDRLRQILETKHQEIARLRPKADLLRAAASERNDFRSLHAALTAQPETLAVIAEVKKASPSAGVIAPSFDPVAIAKAYEAAGANAISVLTDEDYFHGHLSHLSLVRREVALPVLRKDFILDEIQIHEAVVAGADAVLLIVAALDQAQLTDLLDAATAFQLDALVEVHDLDELERALDCGALLLGINNRNLHTFTVDLRTTEQLSQELPPDVVLISESGIRTAADAAKVRSWGADAILVGEALMRSGDVGALMTSFKTPLAESASHS